MNLERLIQRYFYKKKINENEFSKVTAKSNNLRKVTLVLKNKNLRQGLELTICYFYASITVLSFIIDFIVYTF